MRWLQAATAKGRLSEGGKSVPYAQAAQYGSGGAVVWPRLACRSLPSFREGFGDLGEGTHAEGKLEVPIGWTETAGYGLFSSVHPPLSLFLGGFLVVLGGVLPNLYCARARGTATATAASATSQKKSILSWQPRSCPKYEPVLHPVVATGVCTLSDHPPRHARRHACCRVAN